MLLNVKINKKHGDIDSGKSKFSKYVKNTGKVTNGLENYNKTPKKAADVKRRLHFSGQNIFAG